MRNRRIWSLFLTVSSLFSYIMVKLPRDHEEWTPYVSTKLPWTPLVPAFGLEEYGIPIPRRNAETWRNFDVVGMVETDYSGSPKDVGEFERDYSCACLSLVKC